MTNSPNGIPTFTSASPVPKWPGGVELPVYLTMPQVMIWEECVREFRAANANRPDQDGGANIDNIVVRGIVAIVSKWELDGLPEVLTVESFPGSPRAESAKLIAWLIGEISRIYTGAQEVPK